MEEAFRPATTGDGVGGATPEVSLTRHTMAPGPQIDLLGQRDQNFPRHGMHESTGRVLLISILGRKIGAYFRGLFRAHERRLHDPGEA